jgi:hypothetical protein
MKNELTMYIIARKGRVRAARGIVSEALREALGDIYRAPHNARYFSQQETLRMGLEASIRALCRPSYFLHGVSERQLDCVIRFISDIAKEKGWNYIADGPLYEAYLD